MQEEGAEYHAIVERINNIAREHQRDQETFTNSGTLLLLVGSNSVLLSSQALLSGSGFVCRATVIWICEDPIFEHLCIESHW